MPVVNRGEVWMIDFGLAAKVRPALLLTGNPADDELDLITVLLHTTALRGNRWEVSIPKPFLRPGAFHLQQIQTVSAAKLKSPKFARKAKKSKDAFYVKASRSDLPHAVDPDMLADDVSLAFDDLDSPD